MGQLLIHGRGADAALEKLLPGDLQALADMKPKYSLLLEENGGIVDDLMATRRGDDFYVVVNGATKHGDIDYMRQRLPATIVVDHMKEQALLALQGPRAAEVLETVVPGVSDLSFMQAAPFRALGEQLWISRSGYTGEDGFEISVPAARAAEVLETIVPGVGDLGFMQGGPFRALGQTLWISRSGYTGEDGFEISVPASATEPLAEAMTAHEAVKPIGLGARDSLRLEAGLPLYGHDIDRETTPVMAGLNFAINKRRRAEGGFAGALRILAELENGPPQKRVGFDVDGRQPVREGALVLDGEGNELGRITSGGFSPSLQRPIAMGYVASHLAEPGSQLKLEQRGKLFDARVAALPFVPHRYHRKGAA